MDFLERITAVLHLQPPDVVPFAPYDNLAPRGDFERALRNRGMGLCQRMSTVWAEMPDVSIETRLEGDTVLTIYHTPVGAVSSRSKAHAGRIADSESVEIEGLIKAKQDYDPVIFMLENTRFHLDGDRYFNAARDLGRDGIVRDQALDHEAAPYAATRRYFGEISGLDRWIYAQHDHPDHFARLVAAQTRRDERRLELVAGSPAEFLGFGWLEGLWSPEIFRQHELPFYLKWVPYLQSLGKLCALHCDATRSLNAYKDLVAQIGFRVVEAFTPPPVGELSLKEARAALGPGTVVWVNFPETIFYSGAAAAKDYTLALLRESAPGDRLVLGFTEMGLWGATDAETERQFKAGTLAIVEALEECGRYPIAA